MKRSLALFLSFATLTSFVSAQTPRPGPIPGLPSADDAAPVVDPNLGNATGELDPDAIAVPAGQVLEHPTATGIDIAGLIWDHSRKRVILSKVASETQVFFVQRGPMTHREVMKLLKASLLIEGLAMIPDPQDPNIVRLLPSGPNVGLAGSALPYIDNPLDIPATDELIMYRMEFKSLKPEDAIRIFQAAIGQLSQGGKMSAVDNASSVIITENTSVIRQLLKIKEDIDRGSLVEDRWVHITYADVEEISQQLNEIYNQQQSGNSSTRTTRRGTGAPAVPGLPGGAAPTGGGGGGGSAEEVPINIIPDNRTSRLLIIGRPSDLDSVEKLIRSYDVPSDPRTDFRYQLRYLRVGDFIPIASQAIERTLGNQSQGGGNTGGSRPGGGGANRNQGNQNNRNNRNTGQQGGGAGGQGGGGGASASVQAQDVPTEPTAEIVGKTLLVADNVANAVVVQGPPHHIEIVRNLIKELDTAGQQIVISAVIGSYNIGDDLNFGLDLAKILNDSGRSLDVGGQSLFGGSTGPIDPTALGTFAELLAARGQSGAGLSLYGNIRDEFGVFVNALESDNRFKVLQRPVVTTRNNRVATLTSGQRIAVPASTFNGGGTNGTTTNVEFRDVVLELEIQPLINSDNEVTLEISIVNDAIVGTNTVDGNDIPIIGTDTLSSSVTVANGSAIILGGPITTSERNDKTGVPILSRIPGIGRIFGRSELEKDRRELVVILRPEIINGTADANEFRRNFEADAGIARDARKSLPPPTSAGMLPPQGTFGSEQPSAKPRVSLRDTSPKKSGWRWPKPRTHKRKGRGPLTRRR